MNANPVSSRASRIENNDKPARIWFGFILSSFQTLSGRLASLLAIGVLTLFIGTPHSSATTVLNVNLEELLSNSELIFEGEVIGKRSAWSDNRQNIYTFVTFRIKDIIKGSAPGAEIELRFTGGTVDGITLDISGLKPPAQGETGIYFVESTSKKLVQPFYGWSQGHYLVVRDAQGREIVTTRSRLPVIGIDDMVDAQDEPFSEGVAGEIVTSDQRVDKDGFTGPQQPMSKDDFKQKLKERLYR